MARSPHTDTHFDRVRLARVAIIALTCVAVCFVACGGPRTPPPSTSFDVPLDFGRAETVPATGRALVVLDTSQSMRGYFRAGDRLPRTIIQLYLAEHLLNDLSAFGGIREPLLATIGRDFSDPQPVSTLRPQALPRYDFERDRMLNGGSTRLADVFAGIDFTQLDLLVLVTDGTQSVAFGGADSGENASASCAQGNDYGCLIDAVSRRVLAEGLGLWLVAFRTELVGPIPAERLDVNGRRVLVKPLPGTRVDRPAYMWVVATRPENGRRFVDQVVVDLKDSAAKLAAVVPALESEIHAVEFAPLPECRFRATKHAGFRPAPGEWSLLTKELESKAPRTLRHRLICVNRAGVKFTPVPGAYSFAGKWPYANVRSLHEEPATDLVFGDEAGETFAIEERDSGPLLRIDCARLPDGDDAPDPPLAVAGTFHAKVQDAPESWWRRWSTDDDTRSENLGQTLYLDRLIAAIGQVGLAASCPPVEYTAEAE